LSKVRLGWDALGTLSAIASPVWVLDVEHGRNVWANGAGLALWRAGSIEELQAGDHSRPSPQARRVSMPCCRWWAKDAR
jgi:hypothetical protein